MKHRATGNPRGRPISVIDNIGSRIIEAKMGESITQKRPNELLKYDRMALDIQRENVV